MDIFIDGNALDVTLENEQTVGDLFASLENWLSQSGFRCAAFALDGKNIPASEVERAFSARLGDVGQINIQTTSVAQLYADTLLDAASFLARYAGAGAGENAGTEKEGAARAWDESGARSFLFENHPGFARKIDDCLMRGTGDGAALSEEIAERLHEIASPKTVLLSMKEKIYDITARLEVLSLNMQMGKDREATETVYDFSKVAEKLFRIIQLMSASAGGAKDGSSLTEDGSFLTEDASFLTEDVLFFEEFTGVLKEFFQAYQARDSVLAGDLAEYEVSPRLLELYDRLKEGNGAADSADAAVCSEAALPGLAAESIARAC
jgi:hypothetical protein